VLVDHGRTKMLADMAEMLRCLRCGACLNHCVVYRAIGGHAYGGAYPGPMGSVLTPVFDGLEQTRDLPHACTLNGQCRQVCPVDIPLPTMLRHWRAESYERGYEPRTVTLALKIWALVAARPKLYRLGQRFALPVLRLFAKNGWISSGPMLGGWTDARDLPAPAAKSFLSRIADGEGRP
jgi:L-lactate dehydrogenase complex protein LldF